MGCSESTIVFLFIGRLTREKGIYELIDAFLRVSSKVQLVSLWLVGPDEENVKENVEARVIGHEVNINFVPHTSKPEVYMAASDILCLPSHREGFGNVIIEAASCGIPSIGSRIYGITDAIVDGKTGLLFECRDVSSLTYKMLKLASNPTLRKRMGEQARLRVLQKFKQIIVIKELLALLRRLDSSCH